MKLLLISFVTIIVLSCNYIPCSSSSDLDDIKQTPKTSSVVGIYKPDEFTKHDYKEYSNSDSTMLILTDDGKILFKNFPIKTFDIWQDSSKVKINGSGIYKLNSISGSTKIITNITFDQLGPMQPPPFNLYKKGNKYYILIDFGDPDVCSSVRLEQQ